MYPSDLQETVFGSSTITLNNIVAQMNSPGAYEYAILLDGSAVGTAAVTLAIEVLDPANATWVSFTPLLNGTSTGVTNPVSLTNGTNQMVYFPYPLPSVRVRISAVGTATGTVSAAIFAI